MEEMGRMSRRRAEGHKEWMSLNDRVVEWKGRRGAERVDQVAIRLVGGDASHLYFCSKYDDSTSS
jgi:hypothetical protein